MHLWEKRWRKIHAAEHYGDVGNVWLRYAEIAYLFQNFALVEKMTVK